MRIEKVLVPTDFSANAQIAFQTAYDLARQLKAELFLLHVQDGGALRTAIEEEILQSDSTDERLRDAVEQLNEARFSEMCAGLDPAEGAIECVTLRGHPKDRIVEYAGTIGADLIVMGMHGGTAMRVITGKIMGSVTEHILRRSLIPVLVVRPEHAHRRGG